MRLRQVFRLWAASNGLGILSLLVLLSSSTALSQEAKRNPPAKADEQPAPAVQLPPVIQNVVLTAGGLVSDAVVTFNVEAVKGTRFYVEYRTTGIRGASGSTTLWETTSDEPAAVKIVLKYGPAVAADAPPNVLLSKAERLEYRIDTSGCTERGLVTIVSAPLMGTPAAERSIEVIQDPVSRLAFTPSGARRVLFISPKSEIGKDPAELTPRTEIIVGLYTDSSRAKPSEAQQLFAHWRRQPTEVGSAHIKFRLIRTGEDGLLPLARHEVQKVLDAADLENHPENFPAAFARLLSRPERKDELWTAGEFFSIGLKTRGRIYDQDRVYDGELDLARNVNQVNVWQGDDSHMHRMRRSDFRLEGSPDSLSAEVSEKLQPPTKIQFRDRSARFNRDLVADWTTGFIHRNARENGEYGSETLQFAPTRYPGRIVFPKLKVRLNYRDDKLGYLEVLFIEQAEFNKSLPPGTFTMSVPAGTRVILQDRDPVARGKSFTTSEEVPDLAKYVRAKLEEGAQQP